MLTIITALSIVRDYELSMKFQTGLFGISLQTQTEVTLPTIADATFKTVDLDLILQAGLRLSQDKALS